jgi:hypothetical protein
MQYSFFIRFTQLLLAICLFSTTYAEHTVFLIIHGTWAKTSSWYLPNGDFFEALTSSAQKLGAKVASFTWTGGNNNECRTRAAHSLCRLIQSYPPNTHINVIAHSHGSNVGILASQLLAQADNSRYSIDRFYALGAPVNQTCYMPDMRAIHWFYHFFSIGDFIQPVFGLFERCLPTHERIANIRVLLDTKNPNHSQLHDPEIATWLPAIHCMFSQQKIRGFEQFNFAKPGLILFTKGKLPRYQADTEIKRLLEVDRKRMLAVAHAFYYSSDRSKKEI